MADTYYTVRPHPQLSSRWAVVHRVPGTGVLHIDADAATLRGAEQEAAWLEAERTTVLGKIGFVPQLPPPPADPQRVAQVVAALTEKLGYLSKADAKLVREAYKFADGAHLGQFRASGLPARFHQP